jgi:hypothetical protein
MSYQAVVRNSSDLLISNQAVGMQISILQTTATGTAVYVETQVSTTNANGLVTLEIGAGSVVSGDFTTIDWSADSYFIKTETDPAGGTTYTITGTSQLLSVPYALYAKTSGNGAGPIGPQGPAGNDGATGQQGPAGNDGATGLTGPQGATGLRGAIGAQGPAGNDGAIGQQGLAGNDGATGATGAQGPAGADGLPGLDGPQGLQGPTGQTGPAGPQGIPGAAGVGIAQTLSFTSPNLVLSDNGGSIDLTDIINATHTGDVTGATALTITTNAVTTDKILDNNVTDAKIVAVSASKLTGTVGIANGGTNITTYTQGDILYATSATELTKLPAGTAGQVLTMNSGATAPEWVAATTATYAIGETHQGGIIFYLDASGKHGLIAAPSDQSAGIQWYNGSFLDTYAYGNGIGAGEGNSQGIRRWQGTCSSCYASELCQDLILGGQTDWYLPSKYELNLMYENIGQGNALGLGNIGSFSIAYYWSSTEVDFYSAWLQYFSNGSQGVNSKSFTFLVRAVRAF